MSSNDLVCGLVSTDLVRRLVGDHAIGTRGRGITPRSQRALEPSTCDILDADRTVTLLTVSVGEVADPAHWRRTLATEEKDAGKACTSYTGDPGDGYGCTYDSGVRVDGAGVNVLRGDRLIRVTIMQWVDATPAQRLALAEDIARDVDKNVTAYDAGQG
ncbi:hypothetical protein [Nocardioides ultimimeridianus]